MNVLESVSEDPELVVRLLLLIAVIAAGIGGAAILDRRADEKLRDEE